MKRIEQYMDIVGAKFQSGRAEVAISAFEDAKGRNDEDGVGAQNNA